MTESKDINPFLKLVGEDNIENFLHLANNRDIRCLKLIQEKFKEIREPLYKSLLEDVPNDVECLKLIQNALILNPPSSLESILHKLKNSLSENKDDGDCLNLVMKLMGSTKNIGGNVFEEELLGYISAISMYILATYGITAEEDNEEEDEIEEEVERTEGTEEVK
ncbi:Hypothetical protein ORPV_973 [Orpheovirus IHUMI-LCC2]|uniref:Uncharacterized protein n=1 Tax=Orpheovirus IHUMI-LCC2 TaxID=2023057 RepID=A0A2I2L5S2_9VIRU|nr:Hypothetical protein ORPV_973 [Orpheovirus IHUMI-LCC2]SNW62877.1 Hypothetical protein ORPV_973 [Orpheovirus IHUMI-LCC2]